VRPVKHKYRILEVGESYETQTSPPQWLRTGVYRYGTLFDKKFSVTKVTPRDPNSALLIRRTA
jgi:hypothetical protein